MSGPNELCIAAAYKDHGRELYRAARRSLGDAGLAEEAVQETFLRAWRSAHRYDPLRASARSWLFAILRNIVIDLARARSVRPPMAPDNDGDRDPATADDAFEKVLVAWEVEEALCRLRDEHRHALVEVHSKGRPYADVAFELGVPEGTVKSRVYYGIRAMRAALGELAAVS